jgi:predicted RNA-binding protein
MVFIFLFFYYYTDYPNVGVLKVRKFIYAEKNMCLSKVYVREAREGTAIVEEAAKLIVREGEIEIHTLFGEKKIVRGYRISEVDLLKSRIILSEGTRADE